MIKNYFTTELTVYRQVWAIETVDGSSFESSQEEAVATFMAQVQQSASQYGVSQASMLTKGYTIWCAVTADVKDGDVLSDGTNRYTVRGMQLNGNGVNRHIEIAAEWLGSAIEPIS